MVYLLLILSKLVGYKHSEILKKVLFAVSNYHGEAKIDLAVFIPGLLSWNLCFGSVEIIDSFVRYADSCKQIVTKIEERLHVREDY